MQPNNSNYPEYKYRRISDIDKLALVLGINARQLKRAALNAEKLYIPAKKTVKSDGSIRKTYKTLPWLKMIQKAIKNKILKNVFYPEYLNGGIKGRNSTHNANLHCGARIVFSEDISNFFGVVTKEQIFDVWLNFFRFSRDVSELLTALTTYKGVLPQGAATSSALANLVLWRTEPALYQKFKDMGYAYSRFVDDVSVSSHRFVHPEEKEKIVRMLHSFMYKNGYRIKRSKHDIKTSKEQMLVNNKVINSYRPTLKKEVRSKTRSEVNKLEESAKCGTLKLEEYNSVRGKVAHLAQFHPVKANKLKKRLVVLSP